MSTMDGIWHMSDVVLITGSETGFFFARARKLRCFDEDWGSQSVIIFVSAGISARFRCTQGENCIKGGRLWICRIVWLSCTQEIQPRC